jgi:midasin (ATPase involved in ribosome maturation)
MNPPYSSAGKKQLPAALRSKLSEIYVPELDNESDLWSIIDRYTKQNQHATLSEEYKRMVLQFYVSVKQQVQKQTKRGNIGLRNLCRALRFINAAMVLKYPPLKAIYDSLYTCFASHLDPQLQEMVKQ